VTHSLPENVRAAFREVLGAEPTRVQAVSGGMVNQSVRVEAKGVSYFVKWNADAPPGLFETEAHGLVLLRNSNTFRIPEVVAHGEAAGDLPAYLILEWIDAAPSVDERRYAERFGEVLAALHRVTAPTYGLDHDNYIGSIPQANTPTTDWAVFYRDQRILPQMEIARKKGRLPPYREALIRDLTERFEELFEGNNPPSLLHGDLWSGNFIVAAGSQPALVDPSVYYGDREIEIAYTQMFGGFAFFLDAYHAAYPLDPGYEERKPLLHLYPMINHLNHFGEARYGAGVDMICRYYLDTTSI
jgi:protein-ribulosamine 3-kinase